MRRKQNTSRQHQDEEIMRTVLTSVKSDPFKPQAEQTAFNLRLHGFLVSTCRAARSGNGTRAT